MRCTLRRLRSPSATSATLFQYFDSKSPISETRVRDGDLDALINKARTTVDPVAQVNAYKDVQKYIAAKMYVISGMPRERRYYVVQPWLQNYCFFDSAGTATEVYSKVWLRR